MTNRLHEKLWTYTYCAGILLFLACNPRLAAQPGFFNFNYPGPDTLAVGPDCNLSLQGNIPNPTVTSTIGANIITSQFDAVNSGFAFSDLFSAEETAHVFWFVEDDMGHSHTFEFFIFFVDLSPPTFDLTGVNDTLFFNSIAEVPPPPMIPITDNCTGIDTDFVQTDPPAICEAGTFTRTWTATDGYDNTSTFTQTVIISADVTPPTIIVFPQNGSAPCSTLATSYPNWLAAQMAAFSAQDPSGIQSLTNNGPASFPPGCTVPLTVTFKATDNCNFMIPTTAVFTTSDNMGPVVVDPPLDTIAYCSFGGSHLTKLYEWINKRAYSTVYDTCSTPINYAMKINGNVVDSSAVVAAFWASFNSPCATQMIGGQMVDQVSAFVKVDFFATDACGNETFVGNAAFAAVDTIPPMLAGTNTFEQCGGGNDQMALQSWINSKAGASINDDCSIPFWINFSYLSSSGESGTGSFNSGPFPTVAANNCNWWVDVTFYAGDECGNHSNLTLRFQIFDSQPPVFSGLAPDITVYCPDPLPTVPAAIITDNCDLSPAITFTRVYQDSLCDGSYTVFTTWMATDDCGNTATATQNIFVRDTTKPVFTLVPTGIIINCDTFALPPDPVQGININATDVCSPVVDISTLVTSFQNPNPALCSHYSYEIVRTFTATDECGNTSTATQLITVLDNHPPIPTGVLDTTALCSAMVPFPAPAPIGVDGCGSPVAPSSFINTDTIPGACAGDYTLILNWITTDVCNNQTSFVQLVHVVDTVAPQLTNLPEDVTAECDAIPDPPNTATFNGVDNCAAAVEVNLVETEIRNPDTSNCDHWTNYILRREWIATDDCGNARTYTQNIQITDTQAPILIPPTAITYSNDPDDCGITTMIPAPLSVTDICTFGETMVLLKDTIAITGIAGNLPVDTIVYEFAIPNLPPNQPAVSNVSLTIFIDSGDVDQVAEFFKIFGESGTQLGTTATLQNNGSCPSTMATLIIPANQFNQWTADGVLTLTLAPNGTGPAAINPSCPNSRTRANLSYNYTSANVPLDLSYSLDGGSFSPYPPPGNTFLEVGSHTVTYLATDCAGNSSTASVQIQVNDVQPPSIAAPAAITTYISPGALICKDTVILPFPNITENCQMSGHVNKSSLFPLLNFVTDPDAPDFVPDSLTLAISGLTPNAVGPGVLSIKFKGQNDDPREFFNIFRNQTFLTSTDFGTPAGECVDTVITTYVATAAQINSWAATGTAIFKAKPNLDVGPLFDNDFINPCGALLPDQTDGVSRIQAMLEYNYAIISFRVIDSGNSVVASGGIQGNNTSVVLSPGTYTVEYTTTDNAGLMGIATFPLIVKDTIKPMAKCSAPIIIYTNPSGTDYTLLPSQINNGSTDNCSGNLTYALSKTKFTCNEAGNNFVVTLTVTDASGNTSTCSTLVLAQIEPLVPTTLPTCEGDTLFLFANAPLPGPYTYSWTGPNGYMANNIINPIRLNAQPDFQGNYTLTITGTSLCMVSGTVNVQFANLNTPTINPNGVKFCTGDNIVLGTTFPSGPTVTYMWYSDSMGVGTLLGTTSGNTFTIFSPQPGQYHYYLKVKVGDCLTPSSLIATIDVYARPPAIVNDDSITICANDPLVLGTPVSGNGITYMWNGPGYMSTNQNPTVSNSATVANSGMYVLTTKQNGCESIPKDTTVVLVKYTPPTPSILGLDINKLCVGDTIFLNASVGGSPLPDYYEWMDPMTNTIVTGSNKMLIIPNASAIHNGNWRVRAGYDNCFSPWSAPFGINVESYPLVTATASTPTVCQDSILTLFGSASGNVTSWNWTYPISGGSFQQNPIVNPGQPGVYTLIGSTANMCADTATVMVTGGVGPIVNGITVNAPTCATGMNAATLTPNMPVMNPSFSYSWTFNGNSFSNVPVLNFNPVVAATHNGTYVLTVKDTFGCPSTPVSAVLNVQPYIETPGLMISPNPVCAGDSVTLSITNPTAYNGGSMFHWIRPNGMDTVTTGTQLILTNVLVSQSGNYKVFVSQGLCQSVLSASKTLVVNPIPANPGPISNQPVCEHSTLTLNATNPPIPGATYFWDGPGFQATGLSQMLVDASLSFEGYYKLYVVVNGCASLTDSVLVDVLRKPKTPIISPPDNTTQQNPKLICVENLTTSDFITVKPVSQTFGAIYTWISAGDTVQSSGSPTLNFLDLSSDLLAPGLHSYQVVVWNEDNANGDGCNSDLSNTVWIRFDTIPDNSAQTVDNHNACRGNNIPLVAIPPSGNITGMWAQIGGPTLTNGNYFNFDSPNAFFNGVAGNPINKYSFTWTLSSGGCKNFSVDTLMISVVPPETALAGVNQRICSGENVFLNATQGLYSPGIWMQMGQIGVDITDLDEPMSPVTGLNMGNRYVFVWKLEDIGCGTPADTVFIDYLTTIPDISGQPIVCTVENIVNLSAHGIQPWETGKWTSPDPTLEFDPMNASITTVRNLKPGDNIIYWTTNNGYCGDKSRDTFVVNYQIFPKAVNDFVPVPFGTATQFQVLTNDMLPQDPPVVTIIVPPMNGTIIDNPSNGAYVYRPNSGFTGEDAMVYKICNSKCNDACSTATVTFQVGDAGACEIPSIITPNNDGLNDAFIIPAECYFFGEGERTKIEVTVFNQWGDYVYNNPDFKLDVDSWDGKYNGSDLPAGTYYYVIKFVDSGEKPQAGFLLIQH